MSPLPRAQGQSLAPGLFMDDQLDRKDKLTVEIKGMMLGAAGLFVVIALLSFKTDDLSFNTFSSEGAVRNFGGRVGAELADLLLQVFGLAAYAASPPSSRYRSASP